MPNETQLGTIELVATFTSVSVYSSFSGDDNGNNRATLEYREVGGAWRTAPIPLVVDRRTEVPHPNSGWGEIPDLVWLANPFVNQWRGNILFLEPSTTYEVRVTYTDPDGVNGVYQEGTVTTWPAAPPSNGRTLHVALNGNNSNDGLSPATAKASIAAAAAITQPGDTVLVHAGTYTGPSITYINRSGLPDNYITFRPAGDGEVIITNTVFQVSAARIRLRGFTWFSATSGNMLSVTGDWNILEDNVFNVTSGGGVGVTFGGGWGPSISGSHETIQRNRGYWGLTLQWTGGNHVVRQNSFDLLATTSADNLHSIYAWDAMNGGGPYRDTDIYDNTFHNAGDEFIESEGVNMNVRIWGNFMRFNNGSRGGMGIGLSPVMIGPVYVFRNVIDEWMNAGLKLGKLSTGHCFVYQNTFISIGRGFYAFADSGGGPFYNHHFRNNLCIVGGYVRTTQEYRQDGYGEIVYLTEIIGRMGLQEPVNDWDYNCFVNPNDNVYYGQWQDRNFNRIFYHSIDEFRALTGNEMHGLHVNNSVPLLVDPANQDYRLVAEAPVIDAGILLPGFNDAESLWPYAGDGPDLGAFEYGTAPPQVILLVEADAGGSVQMDGAAISTPYQANVELGSVHTFQATPAEGYQCDGWQVNGVLAFTEPGMQLTVGASTTVWALFSEVAGPVTYTLTLTQAVGGTASVSPQGPYESGASVTLTAVVSDGFEFDGWRVNGTVESTANPWTFAINRDMVVVPVFSQGEVPVPVALTLTVSGDGDTIPPPGAHYYYAGDTVSLEAIPAEGMQFGGWWAGGAFLSGANPYSFIIAGDMAIEARFSQAPPTGGGSLGAIIAGALLVIVAALRRK